jgi:betaine-aldehyde dehydrogenase
MYQLYNAVNNQEVNHFHPCDAAQVDAAVESSHYGQAAWAALAPMERGHILRKAANILRERTPELAQLETLDTGRPIAETNVVDIQSATDCLEYYAGIAPAVGGSTMDMPGGSWSYVRREPIGTTAGIGAWNYPLQSAAWKSAPALAFGNSMIFKPSEETPLTALALAEIYVEAGVPPGVFNVVLGAGETGAMLVEHPLVSKISFTGSLATGRKIYASAASQLKKVTLELGGKSPLIIFEDADLEQAVTAAMMANWYSSGQVCSNGTRVFVHESLKDAFLSRLVERTAKLRIGDPFDEDTDIGPMVTKAHQEKVKEYIKIGLADDKATMVFGGDALELNPTLERGYFLPPVIFADCTDDMRIVQEEVFGMVMSVLTFTDEDEVIKRANDTQYGLSAGVFTRDIQRAHRTVAKLQAGTTWINNYNLSPVETPWGGYKQSGVGRENGLAGVESWTQLKSVYVEMNEIESPYL